MAWPRLILAVAGALTVAGCTGSAQLDVDSRPQGARIYVNGEPARRAAGLEARTPATIEIPYEEGEHVVCVKMDGYVQMKTRVTTRRYAEDFFVDGKGVPGELACCCPPLVIFRAVTYVSQPYEADVAPYSLEFPLQPEGQGLVIYMCDEGASVCLDGNLVGSTAEWPPGTGAHFDAIVARASEPGLHTIEVKKEGFKDWKKTVQVGKDCYWLIPVPSVELDLPQGTK